MQQSETSGFHPRIILGHFLLLPDLFSDLNPYFSHMFTLRETIVSSLCFYFKGTSQTSLVFPAYKNAPVLIVTLLSVIPPLDHSPEGSETELVICRLSRALQQVLYLTALLEIFLHIS